MVYSIKAACALLDVRADTVRKWERRYGLVSPERGNNAYRGYTDLDLKRLWVFRDARAGGVSGDEAARRAIAAVAVQEGRRDSDLERLAEAAIAGLNREKLIEVCARSEAAYGKAGMLTAVWIPLLSRLGESALRLKGLEIAKEHFAVAVLRERILGGKSAAGRPLLTLSSPEGELHEIGMLALAQELRQKMLPLMYLGTNLPTDSLCAALSEARIEGAIVCLSRKLPRPALKAMVAKIKRKSPRTTVFLGGPASLPHANLITQLGGVFLGAHLEIGVDKLIRILKETK